MDLTNKQILDAVVALLNPYAYEIERIRAADALLNLLPDLGEGVKDELNCQSYLINGRSRQRVMERVETIYAHYGESSGKGQGN